MSVKSSQSGARMLAVLEVIAEEQPIGASALARLMDIDKSAIQRSLVTLSRAGWISPASERPMRWELSARLFTLAHLPNSSDDLRRRAAPALGEIRDSTGETAFLAIPDQSNFIIIDVAESRQMLRASPRIGEIIPPERSATARAIMPFLDADRRAKLLGRTPGEAELRQFEETAQRGYAVSIDEVMPGSTNIAAPVIGAGGQAAAAIAITAPTSRLDDDARASIGALLADRAARLSRGPGTRRAG